MEIKGFSFYKSYYESLKELDDATRNEILNAILKYIFEDEEPKFSGIKKTIWLLIEPNLKMSKTRSKVGADNYKKKKEERRKL